MRKKKTAENSNSEPFKTKVNLQRMIKKENNFLGSYVPDMSHLASANICLFRKREKVRRSNNAIHPFVLYQQIKYISEKKGVGNMIS